MQVFHLKDCRGFIMRKTKIIATLGPATETATAIKRLISAGVDVFRLNLSHGDVQWHEERVKAGEVVIITTKAAHGSEGLIAVSYKSLPRDVKKGDRILIDDGTMELRVLSSSGADIKCRVITGGLLKEHKGMNLPGVKLSTPSLTEKDKKNLSRGLKWGIDYVAMSFVRSAKDVKA